MPQYYPPMYALAIQMFTSLEISQPKLRKYARLSMHAARLTHLMCEVNFNSVPTSCNRVVS
jgi:hypothetical protein